MFSYFLKGGYFVDSSIIVSHESTTYVQYTPYSTAAIHTRHQDFNYSLSLLPVRHHMSNVDQTDSDP